MPILRLFAAVSEAPSCAAILCSHTSLRGHGSDGLTCMHTKSHGRGYVTRLLSSLRTGCQHAPAFYIVAATYRKRSVTIRQGTCQRCVSRLSAYSNTVTAHGARCYKPVKNAMGNGCGAHRSLRPALDGTV